MIFIIKTYKFPVSKNNFGRIANKNNVCINALCYQNDSVHLVYVSNQKFRDSMDFLLITDENKPHYIYIRDFGRFMCNKAECTNKKRFRRYCLQCFSSEEILVEHREHLKIF